MKKSLLGLVTLLLLASVSAYAQTVTGKVTSATDGAPIPGVSVIIKGTSVGTSTDTEGKFTLTAPSAANDVLVISFIGFATQEISVQDRTNIDVVLKEDATELNEVVVTALGIERDRKSLGYSVTEVKGEQFTQAREINVANSLVGKVAGVNVSSINGGPGSSTSVLIRGVSSLTQTNQPLYVINGVPMSNESNKLKDQWVNEPDKGDGISNLNPDDIESMTVLKGGAAAALYGSRAKAGVILITTKSGKGEGTVEWNSNFVMENIIDLTDWQQTYGQGANGIKPVSQAAALDAGGNSWGGLLDGTDVVNFDGVARPYVAHKDNMKEFYRTGSTFTNTVSFSKGFAGGGIRMSASDLHNKSVVPYSGLKRNAFNLAINLEPVKRLKVDARANFVLDDVTNRPMLSDGAGNANFQAMFIPTSLDINTMKPGTKADGTEMPFSSNTYATNPWFAARNFINDTKRERFIGSLTARYTFDNGFFVQGRVGRDSYTDRITGVVPSGTAYKPGGSISETTVKFYEMNADFLVGKPFKVGTDLIISPSIGGNLRKQQEERMVQNGDNFAIPFVYNVTNPRNKSLDYKNYNQEVQSFYGMVDFSYKNFLFLTATARNDWFSTLAVPGQNISKSNLDILYPSVNGSFAFSEIWDLGPSVTFGKLRAGFSKVGGATDPYQTVLNYGIDPRLINGNPIGTVINDAIPNSALVPSEATEVEVGTELGFLGNRLRLDLAWYNKKSTNEIIRAPASGTSGYNYVMLNIGELRNKGVEALITAIPVQKTDFRWTTTLNGSFNQNEVLKLAAGQNSLGVNTARSGNGFTQHVVGYAAHQIMAFDYKRDADGNIEYQDNGVPAQGDLKTYGSAIAKWTTGWNNEFSYKQFNFGFLIDGKFGGKVFSGTNFYAYQFGLHKETLPLRAGVTGSNDKLTSGQAYYSGLASNVSELFVYDASFVKLRQVTLGYTLPGALLGNVVKSATLSFVGRNLFFISKKTDNIDPEANYSTFAPGLEQGGVPPTRTYGFNLNVKF
ncbi:SusC/RagA family TonB-linked outer membrane protein [Parachryseolinea silvisoli]|uniref:SusC/RagA family TonB-linked outer membrane protein n=1 Tax=Parachryseolinea silvisoli TaxID=2873601 RepID=UPI0022658ED2|nr:SusC/RagA family TonB-linked outer membrane protein [Parachryseolinea silvisoli]MCD9019419.1 SusC/RagA family TonB-linked outer membrane protein [Parachryseolinea silvisoli]